MMGLIIRSKHVVKPAGPTWNGILRLSELDHSGVITPVPCLYLYNKPSNEEFEKIVDTLKESLSRALVPFYPLAGRLRWVGRGGRLELDCNAIGAMLIEAECPAKQLVDFSGDFYSSCCDPIFRDLIPCLDYDGESIHQLPILSVQITRFACGGLCIGTAISHAVGDGRSVFHFTREWAKFSRGEHVLELTPFFDRSVLQDRDHTKVDGSIFRERSAAIEEFLGQKKHEAVNHSYIVKEPAIVLVTQHQIKRLLQVANGHDFMVSECRRPYSRFEVVAAHAWRSACRARGGDPEKTTMSLIMVDSRRRLNPPLPIGYFGNATVEVPVHFQVGEIVSKPLQYICHKIREAIHITRDDYILPYMDFLRNEASITRYQIIDDRGNLDSDSYGSNCLEITSRIGLGGNGFDFGWGEEVFAGFPFGHSTDGETVIMPHHSIEGALVVVTWLHPKDKFIKYMYEDNETNKFTSNLVSKTVASSKRYARL